MAHKQSIVFIINPISGNIDKSNMPAMIAEQLDLEVYDYIVEYTNGPAHGVSLAQAYCAKGYDTAVAVGGDGTIHEVASGLTGTATRLGIIPLGSGNGLARHLGIPLNPKEAIQLLNKQIYVSVDTAMVNDNFMIATAGFGFDAAVAHRFAYSKGRGLLGYVKAVIRTLFQYKPIEMSIRSSERYISGNFFMVSIANIAEFGNGFAISPMSDIQDGLLEVCLIKNVHILNMWSIAWAMYKRTLHRHAAVELFSTAAVDITLPAPSNKIHIDGEARDCHRNIHVRILPKSLQVMVDKF